MKFIHGSSVDLSSKSFELFDYKYDINSQSADLDNIGSGLDAEGIGIYAFIGDSEKSIESAQPYIGSNDIGYIYILEVDVEEDDLLNNRDVNEIPFDVWLDVVQDVLTDIRNLNGFNKQVFDDIVFSFEDAWDKAECFGEIELNRLFKTAGLNIEITEYQNQHEFDSFEGWLDAMEELYSMSETCSIIEESGGVESVLEYAINKSDNLWDVIKNIGEQFAVFSNGNVVESYNETFQKNVMNHLSDANLGVAFVRDGSFAVIFDTSLINIVEKIEIKKEISLENNKKVLRMN